MTLGQLLERYRDTVTPLKRSRKNETLLIERMRRLPFAGEPITSLSAQTFSEYRDLRLKSAKASTLNRELTLISHLYNIAKTEWGIPIDSPLVGVRRPKADHPRNRRLEKGEWEILGAAVDVCRNKQVRPIMEFAVETAMRRGEILAIEWADLNREKRTLHVPLTKNGHPRTIPLTRRALALLERQEVAGLARPFPLTTNSFRLAWKRAMKRSKLKNLRFHDLRHEAVTRFFEMGLSVPEVALISGHKDFRMLARYTHLRAEDVAAKLR